MSGGNLKKEQKFPPDFFLAFFVRGKFFFSAKNIGGKIFFSQKNRVESYSWEIYWYKSFRKNQFIALKIFSYKIFIGNFFLSAQD